MEKIIKWKWKKNQETEKMETKIIELESKNRKKIYEKNLAWKFIYFLKNPDSQFIYSQRKFSSVFSK